MHLSFALQELSRQQRSFQTLDQECTQMKAKLTQELQQAKNTRNILQAELDKVGAHSPPLLCNSSFPYACLSAPEQTHDTFAEKSALSSLSLPFQVESELNLSGSGFSQ